MSKALEIRQLKVWFEVHPNLEQQVLNAARLASLLNTKLVARFLENKALIAAAELPIVSEVLLWSGVEKETSTKLLSKASRTQEKRAAELLAEAAKQEEITYSFNTCYRRALPKKPNLETRAAYWVAGHWVDNIAIGKPICALADDSAAGRQCAVLATAAAERMGRYLLILNIDPTQPKATSATLSDSFSRHNQKDTAKFSSLTEAWGWLKNTPGTPCAAVFMPLAMHGKTKETNAFQTARFPVLLV